MLLPQETKEILKLQVTGVRNRELPPLILLEVIFTHYCTPSIGTNLI